MNSSQQRREKNLVRCREEILRDCGCWRFCVELQFAIVVGDWSDRLAP